MPRNGSGTYVSPSNSWNPQVTGALATPADFAAQLADLANALSQSVSADGQTPIVGNFQMGNNKLTGLAAGTGTGDSVRWEQLFSQGVPLDIASAATVDIGAQNTCFLNVTGTTTITSLGSNYNGPRYLKFTGALVLTYNATTLVIPGGSSILTAPGDIAVVIPKSTTSGTPNGWQVVQYIPSVQSTPLGQCQLVKSGSNLVLLPFNGNKLTINGVNQTIPSGGVTLAPTGTVASTLYYIYAYMNAGVMTLEYSTTARATNTSDGTQIKNGDPTKALVGIARPIAGPVFSDIPAQRFVRSWFNDPGVSMFSYFTANRASTSTSYVELNTEIRCEFLSWTGESLQATSAGTVSNNTSLGRNGSALGIDSSTVPEVSGGLAILTNVGDTVPYSAQGTRYGLSEGYHFVTLLGQVNAGTGTWNGDADGRRASMMAKVTR